jgi:ribosomal protein S7
MSPKEFLFLKKLLHILIKNGKKAKALKVFLTLLKNLKFNENINQSPVDIIYQSLLNVRPLLHLKKVRKSSKVFYLPKLISTEKKTNIALH